MIGLDKFAVRPALMFLAPPLVLGLALGANQTRAGSYLSWPASISYWVLIALVTWCTFAAATILLRFLLRPWALPPSSVWAAGGIAGSFLARLLIYRIADAFVPFMASPRLRQMPVAELSPEFINYYLTNWAIVIIAWVVSCWLADGADRQSDRLHETSGNEIISEAEAVLEYDAQRDPRSFRRVGFLRRVPEHLGDDILALEAEDHYVRVYTRLGDTLILTSISNAATALADAGVRGNRVHRRWWISAGAVVSHDVRGRQWFATLQNGMRVPVSQTYREAARQSGLLTCESSVVAARGARSF